MTALIRNFYFLGIGEIIALNGCNINVLASLVAGCCDAVLLVLCYNCINCLFIIAALAANGCLCRRTILCPVKLCFILMTKCRSNCGYHRSCSRLKRLTVLVLQYCLCSRSCDALVGAGRSHGLGRNISINNLLVTTGLANELYRCRLVVITPLDGINEVICVRMIAFFLSVVNHLCCSIFIIPPAITAVYNVNGLPVFFSARILDDQVHRIYLSKCSLFNLCYTLWHCHTLKV